MDEMVGRGASIVTGVKRLSIVEEVANALSVVLVVVGGVQVHSEATEEGTVGALSRVEE